MIRTKLFKTNRSQAVRLPKSAAFPESVREVTITCVGDTRIIAPVGKSWDDFFAEPGIDFPDREQPPHQEREPL